MDTVIESPQSICQQCESPFTAKRSDRKFCSAVCRNAYHNKKGKDAAAKTQEVDRILHQNFRIFQGLGKSQTTKDQLLDLDFDFNYITHVIRSTNGITCFGLYDYLYYFLPEGEVHILKPNFS